MSALRGHCQDRLYDRGTWRQRGDRWQHVQEVLGCLISYSSTLTNKKREQGLAGKSVCLTGMAIKPSH